MSIPTPIDFENYAAQRGASANFGDAGMHKRRNNQSRSSWDAAIKRQDAKDQELMDRRQQLREQYDKDVSDGLIRPLTRLERLRRTAQGHPDNESVQAARRLLKKYDN